MRTAVVLLAVWLGLSIMCAVLWAVAAQRLRRSELVARLDREARVQRSLRQGERVDETKHDAAVRIAD